MGAGHSSFVSQVMNRQSNLCITQSPAAPGGGREFKTARELQERLIPAPLPQVCGVECFAHCERERADGTFFDLFRSGRNEAEAVIGGVELEGIAGSILVTGIQASLRCMVRRGVELPDAISEIDRILREMAPDAVHGTLLSARVDPAAHHLRYINAGHQTAIVMRRDHTVNYLEPNAAPLALSRASVYRERRIRFDPGDILVAGSREIDGEDVSRILAKMYAPRLREWPAEIGETCQRAAPVVIVVFWRELDSMPAPTLAMATAA